MMAIEQLKEELNVIQFHQIGSDFRKSTLSNVILELESLLPLEKSNLREAYNDGKAEILFKPDEELKNARDGEQWFNSVYF